MPITPYLVFQGTCEEAMSSYARIIGGDISNLIRAGDRPESEVPGERNGWILHCELHLAEGGVLFASDDLLGGMPAMQGCSVALDVQSTSGAARIFDALADGGDVRMPFGPTFWTPGFGTLRDRWGINWMISSSESI